MNIAKNSPALSVVVNNYNYAQYLGEALESALTQLRDSDELIVIDDGSSDGSPALLQRYADQGRIQLVLQDNAGQLQAVCHGLELASKDVVVLLDSDDYYLPGYLERLRNIYRNPEVDYVFAAPKPFGNSATAVATTADNLRRTALPPGPVGSTQWSTALFQEYVGVPTSGNSLRREWVAQLLPLLQALQQPLQLSALLARLSGVSVTESNRPGQSADGAIVRCASLLGARKYYDDEPAFMYRIHHSNKYARSSATGRFYLRWLRKRQFARLARTVPAIAHGPNVQELLLETQQRTLPCHPARRWRSKLLYARCIAASRGQLSEKCSAIYQVLRD